ncbi:MAG: DUF5009 domain-containing protein [Verrucomicrobiae bacterium]|nr:DUF5009 domain-containing protein [Verrucomicrobiae bacterium]
MASPAPPSAASEPQPGKAQGQARGRLVSLDALRGFDMFWILGADSIGIAVLGIQGSPIVRAIGTQLDHVAWEGFRFYDLIFPLFVFMVGVSIVLSLSRMVAQGGHAEAMGRVIRRTVLLYLLGVFVYGGFSTPFDQIRLLGVLQRIAICYGITATLFLYFRPRTLAVIGAGILLGYWALLAWVPAPGEPVVSWAEGRNIVNWFDSRFLPLRKWDGSHDPEGILSTAPAVVTCLLGVFAGLHLTDPRRSDREKVRNLALCGLALVLLGYGWGLVFPIIKKLWTSSYVLLAGGWSLLLLAAFHEIIEIRGWRRWAQPFVWIGMNPIALYLLAHVVSFQQLAERLVGGSVAQTLEARVAPGFGGFIVSLTSILLCVAVARFLYVRQIFIRL